MIKTRQKSAYLSIIFILLNLLIQIPIYSQISVSQSDVLQIFTPGNPIYVIEGERGSINIGSMNGPKVYDFTFLNMQNLLTIQNYDVSQIPALAFRYPLNSHTLGEGLQNIVQNPVLFSNTDSTFFIGEVTIENEYQFVHYEPYELFAKFPLTYNPPSTNFSQWLSVYDTTYNLSWQVESTDHYLTVVDVWIDGYGTLKLPGQDLECLRMRRDYSWLQYKEFLYITKEGVLLVVTNVSFAEPNSGNVNADYQVLFSENFVSVASEKIIPLEFRLNQNYPNPFNPSTKISWQVPVGSHQTIKLFDVLGREIETIVEGYYDAGNHSTLYIVNSTLPSGVYFYQLKAGDFINTKKMLLLK